MEILSLFMLRKNTYTSDKTNETTWNM